MKSLLGLIFRIFDHDAHSIVSKRGWKILAKKEKYRSPYCPVCDACGENGCCSAMSCQQHPDGHYCKSYLRDLKIAYLMERFFYKEIYDNLPHNLKHKYDREWNEVFDNLNRDDQ
jgi:hypothetical protein